MTSINTTPTLHTVWFTTPMFEVIKKNGLLIVGSDYHVPTNRFENKHDLYTDEYGEIQNGSRACCTSRDNSIRINLNPVTEYQTYLGIQIPSLQKLLGKTEIDIIEKSDLDSLYDILIQELKEVGISIAPETLRVSRVDINMTFHLKYPLKFYVPFLSKLSLNYMPVKSAGSGLYLKNKSKEMAIYDKREQLHSRKSDLPGLIDGEFSRIEFKLIGRDSIEQIIEKAEFPTFINSYQKLVSAFEARLHEMLDVDTHDLPLVAGLTPWALLDSLGDYYIKKYGKRGFDTRLLKDLGAGFLASIGIQPHDYREFIETNQGKRAGWKKEKTFQEMQLVQMLLQGTSDCGSPYRSLFEEFKSAVLGSKLPEIFH